MELKAQKRDVFGKKLNAEREKGNIPAELYGHGTDNQHLMLDAKEFDAVLKEAGESSIVTVVVDDKKTPVLIHDVDRDYVNDVIMHVDLYAVRMDEKTTVPVAINFVGEAPAVKEEDGVLVRVMQEITVEALPADLPHEIEVDLSSLTEIGSAIHVQDITVPKGVTLKEENESVIVTVTEATPEEEEEVAPMSIDDVEVEGEKKEGGEGEASESESNTEGNE